MRVDFDLNPRVSKSKIALLDKYLQSCLVSSLSIKTLEEKSSAHHFLASHDQRKVSAIKESNSFLCLRLLSSSADINLNPGPATSSATSFDGSEVSTYHPCQTGHKCVTWEDRAACCEEGYRVLVPC